MNKELFRQFLVKAKKSTYASSGDTKARITLNGSKEYVFIENDLKYIDIYRGHKEFKGKEEVFQDKKLIWQMEYMGKVLSKNISVNNVYTFLGEALKIIPEDKPFRGPEKFTNEKYRYVNNIKGDIDNFSGTEKIFYQDELVYELTYKGMVIRN